MPPRFTPSNPLISTPFTRMFSHVMLAVLRASIASQFALVVSVMSRLAR
jgi:hypothetical protein